MANTKISQLPSATTPVVGTEVLPIVQSSTTSKVSIANLTAGRAVSASSYDATGATAPANGMFSLAAGSLAFSVASSQIGKFLSGGGGGAFEVDDAASAGYDVRRYISVTNLNTGTAASASVFSSAFSTQASLTAFSPSHATTALANKSVLFGSNRSSNASSGTVVADFSTGTNQIQFYLGTTASPLSVAHFLGAAGSFEVSDFAVGAGYNGQRYIQVGNVSTGTSAYAWTGASALNVNAKLAAFSPSHSSTALANKTVLFGADATGASSGTAIADFSTGSNSIQFYLGTAASPTAAALLNSSGFSVSDFSGSTGVNAQRYIEVSNPSTGTSAYSWVGAQTVNVRARANAFSPSHTSATLANKAAFYGLDSGGASSGTIFADFSTGTNQIEFYVGTVASPTLAGTISSTGNWNLYTATLTAGSFTPTSSSFQANSIYYPSTNTISVTNNSAVTASFTSANNFDVGTGNPTNASRSIIATNLSTGTSANASVSARSDVQYANLQAYSSTYPAASGITIAGKAILYAAGSAGSSGLTLWDNSNSQSMQFVMGSTVAATINSSAVLSLTNNPILTGGTANGVAYLNGSKILTTGTGLVFDGTNLGLAVTPVSWRNTYNAFQIGIGGALFGRTATQDQVNISANYYVNTSNADTYINNGYATLYKQNAGQHQWYYASNNTSGANAALGTFTQAMTLDASGNLAIARTSARATLDVAGNGAFNDGVAANPTITFGNELSTGLFRAGNGVLGFTTGGTERARIDSSGNFIVGPSGTSAGAIITAKTQTASNSALATLGTSGDTLFQAVLVTKFDNNSTTSQNFIQFQINNGGANCGKITANGANTAAFGSTSDERVKENISDLPSQLSNIMALRPVEYDYIESYGGGHQIGFIAQEMQQVYPDVIAEDDSEEKILSITGWSKTEARLVKAIQEQQALITALTARIAALEAK